MNELNQDQVKSIHNEDNDSHKKLKEKRSYNSTLKLSENFSNTVRENILLVNTNCTNNANEIMRELKKTQEHTNTLNETIRSLIMTIKNNHQIIDLEPKVKKVIPEKKESHHTSKNNYFTQFMLEKKRKNDQIASRVEKLRKDEEKSNCSDPSYYDDEEIKIAMKALRQFRNKK